MRYDRTYFDKIVASLLPLLEKLTTGKTAELLAPNYMDMNDPGRYLTGNRSSASAALFTSGWMRCPDGVVASAVGNSMFADLVSVAGHIYKHGMHGGLPTRADGKLPINLHCDEFNELMGTNLSSSTKAVAPACR